MLEKYTFFDLFVFIKIFRKNIKRDYVFHDQNHLNHSEKYTFFDPFSSTKFFSSKKLEKISKGILFFRSESSKTLIKIYIFWLIYFNLIFLIKFFRKNIKRDYVSHDQNRPKCWKKCNFLYLFFFNQFFFIKIFRKYIKVIIIGIGIGIGIGIEK